MEGRHALPRASTKGHLLWMCGAAFLGGCFFEGVLCVTGFYNVYTYKAAEKTAKDQSEQEDFWARVQMRREARKNAGLINTKDNHQD